MRGIASALTALAVIGLGYWAYNQNIQTKHALREVARLQADIAAEREHLARLRAEFAYHNRPDNLRELAELNFATLGLFNMTPDQFGEVTHIPYAPLETAEIHHLSFNAEDEE